jgi:hypothetical protein
MKKTIILGLAVAVMTVTSFTVLADSKYPAADFEPQVIYIDKNIAAFFINSQPFQHNTA